MTKAWTRAIATYDRATEAAAAFGSDDNEAAFDRAASAQGDAIMALLAIPAPDLAAVATKMQIMHRDGYQHMLNSVLADVERLAAPAGASTASPALEALIARHEAVARAFNAAPFEDKPAEDLYLASLDELDGFTPTTCREFARAFAARFSHLLPPNDDAMERLVNTARRLAAQEAEDPASAPTSDAVVEAWRSFCAAFTCKASIDDGGDEQRFYETTDAADEVMVEEIATTWPGVVAKLRRVFAAVNTDHWAERLAIGEDTPENRAALEKADIYARMLWSAIENVERLAGGVR